MDDRTAGEVLFEAYLAEHGYDPPEHEPDLGTVKRPDYVIERDGQRCVVEVKEFDPATRSFPGRPFGSTDLATVLKPVRGQIREAAHQLKDVSHLGLPLVVVLTNPHGAFVIMGTNEMIWAMYGDPIVMMDIDRAAGAAVGEPRHGVGRNGRLARDHQYISAVAVLGQREHATDWYDEMRARYANLSTEERWNQITLAEERGEKPEGAYMRVDAYKTLSPTAVELPDAFFHGEHDRVFEPNEAGTAYVQTSGPQPPTEQQS